MLIQLLMSIASYLTLLYISINLLGFFVRGLFSNIELENLKSSSTDFVKNEIKNIDSANRKGNIFGLILIFIYLYLLFHFWNIGVLVVAIIFMIARLPDLLWEIKNGKKLSYMDAVKLPKNITFYLTTIVDIIAFPLLWYFLFRF